jgi:hypothetical protein
LAYLSKPEHYSYLYANVTGISVLGRRRGEDEEEERWVGEREGRKEGGREAGLMPRDRA